MFLIPTPIRELFEEEEVRCADCGELLVDEGYFAAGQYYCEGCCTDLVRDAEADAKEYANENCKITYPIPRYDETAEHRCTPEEYANGYRESYTPNAYACYCRHQCTNYDELIRDL